jgi:hypothetical protein
MGIGVHLGAFYCTCSRVKLARMRFFLEVFGGGGPLLGLLCSFRLCP